MYREAFTKIYTANWTNEIFKISQVERTNPMTYKLEDSERNIIKVGFYAEKLQKVKHPDVYSVEKGRKVEKFMLNG